MLRPFLFCAFFAAASFVIGALIGCSALLGNLAAGKEIDAIHALYLVGSYVLGIGGCGSAIAVAVLLILFLVGDFE